MRMFKTITRELLYSFRDSLGRLVFMIFGFFNSNPNFFTSIIIKCQRFDYSALKKTIAL